MKKIILALLVTLAIGLSIAAVRKPVVGSTALQIMTGTSVSATDGTGTNTFAVAFSTVPNVVLTQHALTQAVAGQTNTINTITVSGFTYTIGKAAITNQWIAVGAP